MAIRSTESTEAASGGTDQKSRRPEVITGTFSEHHAPGTGSPLRWFFSSIWLIYLIQPVAELFGYPHGVA